MARELVLAAPSSSTESGLTPRSPIVYTVLVNWNGWPDTDHCLRSLRNLNYPNNHVVVIDNASTDDSVLQIRKSQPEVRIVESHRNGGFGAGCNIGISLALEERANYIWLLNNDAQAAPDALAAMIQVAEADPRMGAIGSVIYDLDRDTIQTWGGGRITWWGASKHFISPRAADRLDYISGASLLLRAAAVREIGLFDEDFFMYWEDTDLCFRLRKDGWKLAVAENAKISHKMCGSTGRGSPLMHEHKLNSYVRFFRKHYRFARPLLAAGLLGRMVADTLRQNTSRSRLLLRSLRASQQPFTEL
jgi:GT2 family glycosyltransferase